MKLILLMLFAPLAFAHETGLIIPPDWEAVGTFQDVQEKDALPESFSLATKWGKLPPVRNQGNCGSCWAFATTGQVEIAHFYKTGKIDIDLAEQEQLSCSHAGSCNGGFFTALNYDKSHGLGLEADFPYKARDLSCKKITPAQNIASWAYIGNQGKNPTVNQIKTVIASGIPVAVTVAAGYRAFQKYNGGVFGGKECTSAGTDHMVLLVGWDDTAEGPDGKKGAWLMRNSWGEKWGEGGYMRIRYGCSHVGEIASTVTLPKRDDE